MTTVWITEDVVAALTAAAREAAPDEIGGIALGVERDGEPLVARVVAFAFAERSANSFVIPAGITPAVVDELRQEDDRLGYLGDWHSHPLNAKASDRDRKTLRSVAARRELETRPAVLLVVRAVGKRWEIDALADDGRTMRKAAVGMTGPLPWSGDAAEEQLTMMASSEEAMVEALIEEVSDHPWYRDLDVALRTVRGRRASGQVAMLEDVRGEMESRRTADRSLEMLERAAGRLSEIRRAVRERREVEATLPGERDRLLAAPATELLATLRKAADAHVGTAALGFRSGVERYQAETMRMRREMIEEVVLKRLTG